MASLMALPPGQNMRGKARIRSPKDRALSGPSMRVQATLTRSQERPANSI